MLERELKEIWKSSSQAEQVKFDLSRLVIDLDGKINQIDRAIRRRDRREIAIALLMIPVFGYLAYEIPFLATRIGILLTILCLGWNVFKIKNNKKHKSSIQPTLSFREQLEKQKANALQEVRLLDTVLYWFLLPSFVAHTIAVLGLGNPADYGWSNLVANELLPVPFIYKAIYLIAAAFIYIGILWMNKRVINKTLKPLIENIESVKRQLESEN